MQSIWNYFMTNGAPCMHACIDHTKRVHWNVHSVSMQLPKTTAPTKFIIVIAIGGTERARERGRGGGIDCNIPIKATAHPIPATNTSYAQFLLFFIFYDHTHTHSLTPECLLLCLYVRDRRLASFTFASINIGRWIKSAWNTLICEFVPSSLPLTSSHLPLTLSAEEKFARDICCECATEWLGAEIFYYLEIITHTRTPKSTHAHINIAELFTVAYFRRVHIIIEIKWLIGENHRRIDHRLEWMDISERLRQTTGVMNSCGVNTLPPLLLLWSLPWSRFCRYENRICW